MNVNGVEVTNTSPVVSVAAASSRQQELPRQAAQQPEVDHEQVKQMAEEMQSHIEQMNVSLSFSTYGDHGEKIAISVINKETGQVIREIPPKEIQSLYSKMNELAGMIFNMKA